MKDFRIFACLFGFGFLPQLFIKRVGGSPQINWDSNWNSVQEENNQWFPPGSSNNRFSTAVTDPPWFPSPAAGTGTGAELDFGEGPLVEGECLLTGCQAASDKSNYCTSKTFKFAHWRYPCSQPANAVNVRCCKEPPTFDPSPLKGKGTSSGRPRPTKAPPRRTTKAPTRAPVTARTTTTRKPTATSPSSVRTTTTTTTTTTAPAPPLSSTLAPSVSPIRTSTRRTTTTTIANNNTDVITPPPAIDFFDYFQ